MFLNFITIPVGKKKSIFEDANLFEDLRFHSKEYVSKCRKKVLNYIPKQGKNMLDFASGPIQYPEYLLYSKNFTTRHCVDFSKDAIINARKKLEKMESFIVMIFLISNLKKLL